MYAEIVVNVEAALEGTFHYGVPADLQATLQVGHLVEIEFGRRLAQGIVVAFDEESPVEETKPVIGVIDPEPVVRRWQIALARWMSQQYVAPLNACLRQLLPPGLTRWADVTLEINRYWEGGGALTDRQQELLSLLRRRGDMRGRQISHALPGGEWKTAANQLVKRGILNKGSVLDAPRARPKEIRTAELIAGPRQIREAALSLGRSNLQAAVLYYLSCQDDPLPAEAAVLAATGADKKHLEALEGARLIIRPPGASLVVAAGNPADAPPDLRASVASLPQPLEALEPTLLAVLQTQELVEVVVESAAVGLAIPTKEVNEHLFRLRRAETLYRVLQYLAREATAVALAEIFAATGAEMSHLRKLAKHDLIRFGSEEVWRDPLADRDFVAAEPPLLTADQVRVWGRIRAAMLEGANGDDNEAEDGANEAPTWPAAPAPFLLFGVTGSGKTEIYMRAIELALQQGQQAIVLVPEIALTPQTVRRFASRFPGRVAILHSRLSDGERYDTWRRARQGLFDIVIGPRSALFTPLPNLRVIVVDEEHDPSYKQTPPVPPPYYHARDTAIELGRILGATVILGSATPDLVSYHRAQAGRYQLLELPKRIMGHRERITSQADRLRLTSRYAHTGEDPDNALTIPLPPIQIVDLRQELRAGNRSIFSRALQQAITETLDRREQLILFLNRRGTATFVICRDCGYVVECKRCDLPLTYHRNQLSLVCHQCGRKEPIPRECPQCGSKRIRYFGLGTEEVESLVQQRWPQARITRWDRDTTAGRDTHEALLSGFINQEADVLVGTQMIAKGLDLPLVTLVGVISADISLGLPDYRTGERTFQVLAQVAGRAGRGLLGGRVIIQTYQPGHYAIQAAAEHDYNGFYVDEIRFRTQHSLPPFRRLARLLIADPVDELARRQADELAQALRLHVREKALAATEILGPTPPFFSRVDGRYRWHILVRSPDPVRLLDDFHVPARWMVDVDPVSTL